VSFNLLLKVTPLMKPLLLRCLDLGNCNITDAGLQSVVAQLQQLQHLNLSRCSKITVVGLQSIVALQPLQHLDLSSCSKITDVGL
jgi:F-box and leucine-rich repeat protein 14